MPNLLLISVADCDTRVALLEDGRLAEFYLESRLEAVPTGNIYQGRVLKLLPGMAAAFVDVGLERPAYLYAENVTTRDDYFDFWLKEAGAEEPEDASAPPSRRAPPPAIDELLCEGQEVMVQALRGPMGHKGARLTTHITLAGHYLVYMPAFSHLGVSRRITEEPERQRLRDLIKELKPAEGGLIARTAARREGPERLAQERENLVRLWHKIRRKSATAPAPALLYQEMAGARRLVRELYTPEVDRVVVDDRDAYDQVLNYLEDLSPREKYRVELYTGDEPLFAHYGLETDWPRLLAPKVWLKSGGYLLFGTTEALTAIDVNTGRFVGRRDQEETVLKTNLEAAREIARQLRLRNIGGLIVIDFIDMEQAAHREQVHQALLAALLPDRAKTTVLPISALGLLEMTRQRLRDSLAQKVTTPCGCCGGEGLVLSAATLAHDLLRRLAAEAREFPRCRLAVSAHPEVAALVRQEGEALLKRLAQEFRVTITITSQPHFPREHFDITRQLPPE